MDIDAYKNFITIVESGNYSKAKEILGIAQPALAQQVRTFENLLKAELIHAKPGGRTIELTEAGKVFLTHAKEVYQLQDKVAKEIRKLNASSNEILRLSTSFSRSQNLVEQYLVPFHNIYPKTQFELIEDILPNIEISILNSITELAISNTPLTMPQSFDILHSKKERAYAVFSKNSKFINKDKRSISLKELSCFPLSICTGSDASLIEYMSKLQCSPQIIARTSSRSTNIAWALADDIVAIVPTERRHIDTKNLRYIPISDEDFYTERIVFKLKGQSLSPLAQKFLDFYLEQSKHPYI